MSQKIKTPLSSKLAYVICFLSVIFIFSCQKDLSYFEGNANITASVDTLMFDTVFTTVGSATRIVKIYNREESPILLDVSLKNGDKSKFRINVDGIKGPIVKGVEILPQDSIYVFAEVTIDPNMPVGVSPFVIEEDLILQQGGQDQKIVLTAWGQNANYISDIGNVALLSCKNQSITFSDPKPYVIYGILLIDSCNVILPQGTRIYVHGGIVGSPTDGYYQDGQIIVLRNGKITAQGTYGKPVTIQGDRLEKDYAEDPGQWGGLRFYFGSKGNNLDNVFLKNSIVGMVVDSAAELTLKNSVISNTSSAGILGVHSTIKAENTLVYNNGGSSIQLAYGGNYTFNYCTISSFTNQREAISANNKKCLDLDNDITCQVKVAVNPLSLSMTNCILTGAGNDEISFDNFTKKNEDFVFKLKNCVVKVDELLLPKNYPNFFDNCANCYNQKRDDKLFLSSIRDDYRLDTMSVARNKGIFLNDIQRDLIGKTRKSTPDVGCYEF